MKIAKIIGMLIFIISNYNAQVVNGYFIPLKDTTFMKQGFAAKTMAGTCASPDGNMNVIGAPPGSYAALQAGGYCNPGSYGKNGTVCWSFVPTQGSVTINSGYSQTGCTGMSFGPFTLYTCSPACTNVGSGLTFLVTPGQCYTWCMSWSGAGPPACNVIDWCPYYQQFPLPLPIELSYFAGSMQGDVNVLQWKTESEKNNLYFDLEISSDAQNWNSVDKIKGSINSHSPVTYIYNHKGFSRTVNYYRLKQVDIDGGYKYHGIIAINNTSDDSKVIRKISILGTDITEGYQGIYIEIDESGHYTKKCCNPN